MTLFLERYILKHTNFKKDILLSFIFEDFVTDHLSFYLFVERHQDNQACILLSFIPNMLSNVI